MKKNEAFNFVEINESLLSSKKKKKRAWAWERMKVAFEIKKKKKWCGRELGKQSMCIRRGRELFVIY